MSSPLVTRIDDGPDGSDDDARTSAPEPVIIEGDTIDEPTVIIIFNERTGPSQVAELISAKHAFIQLEAWETHDEQGRPAYVLCVACETATAEQLFALIGSRLPDYIQARRFPPSRLVHVRETGTRIA